MNLRKLVIILSILTIVFSISSQEDQISDSIDNNRKLKISVPENIVTKYVEGMLNDTSNASDANFTVYPIIARSPETSWQFALSSLYVYSAKKNLNNRLSELKSFTFYTLKKQYGINAEHALYSDENLWLFYGKIKVQAAPLDYYGYNFYECDNNDKILDDSKFLVDVNVLNFKERALRAVIPNLYAGLEFDIQIMNNFDDQTNEVVKRNNVSDKTKSTSVGLGAGMIYNNIHNFLNPRKGVFSEFAFLRYSNKFKSDYNLTSVISDNRFYMPINDNNVLAFQFYSQFTIGPNPPFNLISLMGGENLMRGYYQGRYRDRHLLATQLEYRILPFNFSKRWGATCFLAMGQVFGENNIFNDSNETGFKFDNILPSGGVGARFLLFKEKDIYLRLDYGITRHGNNYYITLGEAF
mgnify:CR=1 FL=1